MEKAGKIKTYSKDLTEREKAVIIWAIVTHCDNWPKIYILSRPNAPETYSENSLTRAAAKWKKLEKVSTFYREQSLFFEAQKQSQQQPTTNAPGTDGKRDGETKPGNEEEKKPAPTKIDFTETQNALQELNRLANEIQDPKARADAIQAIQKLINQTRTDDETGPEIQRFYTSLRCRDCVLYQQARKSDENGPK